MFRSLRVGFFLAYKYLRHTSIWTTLLVIFIMFLTFMNLVATAGVLQGFPEGMTIDYREGYAGDVLISNRIGENYIERSTDIMRTLDRLPYVDAYAPRYVVRGVIEADYQVLHSPRNFEPDIVGVELAGVNPSREDRVTNLSKSMIEGEFFSPGDEGMVLLGRDLLERYSETDFAGFETLTNVYPGSKVKISTDLFEKEFTVKGIVGEKIFPTARRVYLVDKELKKLGEREDQNVDEIALDISHEYALSDAVEGMKALGIGQYALVRTHKEAEGQLIGDLREIFGILNNIIGSLAVVVASAAVFIVVYITAVMRKRFIGIQKAIGLTSGAIRISFILISFFYTVVGLMAGTLVLYTVLIPYFYANPIEYPFSYGVLFITDAQVLFRSFILLIAALFASLVPISLILKENTIDAVLGR